MLLLLKTPPSGATTATLGLALGLMGDPGAHATADLTLGLSPPTAIEANVFGNLGVTLGLQGISVGLLTRSASCDLSLPILAAGGFGDIPTLTLALGLSGTVGSFLQGTGSCDLTLGITGAASVPAQGTLPLTLGLSAAADLSGGTLTPTAMAGLALSLNGAPLIGSVASLDLSLDLQPTSELIFGSAATQMRVTFQGDSIRMFFKALK